jgi:hypothetical protein
MNHTDEEIGAAVRAVADAYRDCHERAPSIMIGPSAGGSLFEAVGALVRKSGRSAERYRALSDDHGRVPYTTEDIPTALAAETPPEVVISLDIWSDEHAPPQGDEPLLQGVFGAESTVPEWLTQEEERYATTGSVDAPSIFDGVEVPELTPAQVAEMVPLREGFRWHVGRSGDLDLEMSDEGNLVGWVCARRAAWTVDLDNETEVHDAGNLLANARALARHCGALAENVDEKRERLTLKADVDQRLAAYGVGKWEDETPTYCDRKFSDLSTTNRYAAIVTDTNWTICRPGDLNHGDRHAADSLEAAKSAADAALLKMLRDLRLGNLIPSGPSLARILDPWHCPKTTRGQ